MNAINCSTATYPPTNAQSRRRFPLQIVTEGKTPATSSDPPIQTNTPLQKVAESLITSLSMLYIVTLPSSQIIFTVFECRTIIGLYNASLDVPARV